MTAQAWSVESMPDQSGRLVMVTGASPGGLGHHTALELSRRGARVVLAGRNQAKLDETTTAIRSEVPDAELEQLQVDLASLESVRRAGQTAASLGPLDVLVNNAGVMAPGYARTNEGFELQMGTNHFGPFLLTGLLLPQLVASGRGRVVTVSSQMHRMARSAPVDDPRSQQEKYRRWPQYARSKLANLLFTFELDRRLRSADLPVQALAAHPGYAATHLVANGQLGRSTGLMASILHAVNSAIGQSAAHGAWPLLMAATADLPGSTYCGPGGRGQMSGPARVVDCSDLALDQDAQRSLWDVSQEAVGLHWP